MRAATLTLLPFALLACLSTPAQTPARPQPPVYESDAKFVAAMNEARLMEKQRRYEFAIDDYKKASKIAGGQCAVCLEHLFSLQVGLRKFKDALATVDALDAIASTPALKSIAASDRGMTLVAQAGEKPKPEQLEAAHSAFQAALATYPRNVSAQYQDGCVLARMGKTDEAKQAFTACSRAAAPSDPMRLRAAHFAENPELSLHKMAPAFEVTALDGTRFNLDNMSGRVVLIDFWATWCGPCKQELPNVRKIARDFANEPLTIISISWDDDEAKWKEFVGKNEMTWLQYRDADHKLSERFDVNSIPRYFTIDSDGVLTGELFGSGNDVEGKLKKLLKRARESRPTTEPSAQTAGTY